MCHTDIPSLLYKHPSTWHKTPDCPVLPFPAPHQNNLLELPPYLLTLQNHLHPFLPFRFPNLPVPRPLYKDTLLRIGLLP